MTLQIQWLHNIKSYKCTFTFPIRVYLVSLGHTSAANTGEHKVMNEIIHFPIVLHNLPVLIWYLTSFHTLTVSPRHTPTLTRASVTWFLPLGKNM